MKELKSLGQIEISCSPMHHPILPLLCDSSSAHESLPGIPLPVPKFKYPEDAETQVKNAVDFFINAFGYKPAGMWPSEGSVSDEALNLMSVNGLKWAATDEQVLKNTIKDKYNPLDKYFPWKYKSGGNEITLFFRDHNLSDAIGFTYSNWHHFDAVNDFMHRLRHIRSELVNNFGENSLESAVVPVILDGENCWEFYKNNGWDFLKELYEQLSKSDELKTITISESIPQDELPENRVLSHIQSGSWIDGNFNVWLGSPQNVIAWSILSKARKEVESAKDRLTAETVQKAMEEIYIAEGSDWFWWYCDAHNAPNKPDFDVLFRWHIAEIYNIIGLEPPLEIQGSIGNAEIKKQTSRHKESDIKYILPEYWENAGSYDPAADMASMHRVSGILEKFRYGSDDKLLFFRIELKQPLTESDTVEILIMHPFELSLLIGQNSFSLKSDTEIKLNHISFFAETIIEASISKEAILDDGIAQLKILTKTADGETIYPRQGRIECKM